MLIINADDLGNSRKETDAALRCFKDGRVTSASAMVFMEDSQRAAELAIDAGMDVGLHLNLSRRFTNGSAPQMLRKYHDSIVSFMTASRYSLLLYNPLLRKPLQYAYQAQVDEFSRLYGRSPSHIDGHQHKHLCTNLLIDGFIPRGSMVRRNFSFNAGEKGGVNRAYRRIVDVLLARRYRLTDYFFALSQCLADSSLSRVAGLSADANVELMTHPANMKEFDYLMSDDHLAMLSGLMTGTYSMI